MAGTEQSQGDGSAQPAKRERRRSRIVALIFLLIAIAVLGVVVFYPAGIEYLVSLLHQGTADRPAVVATSTVTPDGVALKLPTGVSEDLAKRAYVEQIQSQAVLKRMASGEVKRLKVTSVTTSQTAAAVFVEAFFADGTHAPGVMQLVRRGNAWYFMSLTGTANVRDNGYADSVSHGVLATGLQSDAKVVAASGITTFDNGVINAMLADQVANQSVTSGMLDGSLDVIELGTPVPGAGTTIVPATLSGKRAQPAAGEAVMVNATVAQDDLTFITSFRAN